MTYAQGQWIIGSLGLIIGLLLGTILFHRTEPSTQFPYHCGTTGGGVMMCKDIPGQWYGPPERAELIPY